jgi:hypothetical protein
MSSHSAPRANKFSVLSIFTRGARFTRDNTMDGGKQGYLFISLARNSVLYANPIECSTELLRHATELAGNPSEWMTWNYRTRIVSS